LPWQHGERLPASERRGVSPAAPCKATMMGTRP
jgi:hypothetical protein